jgi:hypothetical protein
LAVVVVVEGKMHRARCYYTDDDGGNRNYYKFS